MLTLDADPAIRHHHSRHFCKWKHRSRDNTRRLRRKHTCKCLVRPFMPLGIEPEHLMCFSSFLKMVSVGATGGTITNYSPRFTLTGMTGVFPANVVTGLQSVTGTDGPASVNAIAAAQGSAGAVSDGEFAVPFYQQTGLTRYAPMQIYPPTKITMKTKTPSNPKSPWTLATTYLPRATIQTTITQSITWSFSQMENTVCHIQKQHVKES
jgi:hypothetical protein